MNAGLQVSKVSAATNDILAYEGQAQGVRAPKTLNDSIQKVSYVGWGIVALFFGVFGTWAVTAPLNGAVVATGVVKIDGNRKSVQHLDGGIVKELRVKEGDKIKAGDVLVVLDESQARAENDVLSQQYVVLRATEERLRAEFSRDEKLVLPLDLSGQQNDPYVKSIWSGQIQQFETRRTALEGQRRIIREKMAQLQSQIKGSESQIKAYIAQLASIQAERDSITPLVEKGFIARPRVLQLERTASGLEGQIGEANGNIARAKEAISEQRQNEIQLDNDRMSEVSKDLRDVQARSVEVIPRLMNASAILYRTSIRAPYAGKIVGLNIFSVGGVIGRGEKIMDIVPDQDSLIIEAQVGVDDISDVHPGTRAEVHLTAYKQRTTPIIHGDVVQVSADRLTEPRTGAPYYVALVRADESELASMPEINLYPGMSVSVMIPTIERTAYRYLVGPFVASFQNAFRQK